MATLLIRDETAGGSAGEAWPMQVPAERMTVRELIRERVYQEVRDAKVRAAADQSSGGKRSPKGDFDPEAAHRRQTLVRAGQSTDWREHDRLAAEAFEAGGFVVLVGDRQAESLNETIEVGPSSEVTFLKLTPLVGG